MQMHALTIPNDTFWDIQIKNELDFQASKWKNKARKNEWNLQYEAKSSYKWNVNFDIFQSSYEKRATFMRNI